MKIEATAIFSSRRSWYFEISVFKILKVDCIQFGSQKNYFEISVV